MGVVVTHAQWVEGVWGVWDGRVVSAGEEEEEKKKIVWGWVWVLWEWKEGAV